MAVYTKSKARLTDGFKNGVRKYNWVGFCFFLYLWRYLHSGCTEIEFICSVLRCSIVLASSLSKTEVLLLPEHGSNKLGFVLYSTLIVHNMKDFGNENVLLTIVRCPLSRIEATMQGKDIHLHLEPFRLINQ